jgi:predicted nucleic acid-binding protein
MIVLDTTVLVYAKGAAHPLRDPCRALIEAIASREIVATTTVEAIQELVHVWARRRDRAEAAALGNDYAELLSPLLPVTGDHLRGGLALFAGQTELGSFDAMLAAAAIASGADALVSADRAFAGVEAIAHVLPDAAGIASLLRES